MLVDCKLAIEEDAKADEIIVTGMVTGFRGAGKSLFLDRLLFQPPNTSATRAAKKVVRVEVPKATGKESKWKLLESDAAVTTAVAEKISFNVLHHPSTDADKKAENLNGEAKDEVAYYSSKPQIKTPFQAIASCYDTSYRILPTGLKVSETTLLYEHYGKMWTHYISDVGGLPQFQKLFPHLIRGYMLFYYVFRADKSFDDKLSNEEGGVTAKEAILQFLACVNSIKVIQKPQEGSCASPKVLFIATYADKLEANQLQEVDKALKAIVKDTQAGVIIPGSTSCMLLAVNNLGRDDSCFEKVRSVVEKVATANDDYLFKVPCSWSLFSATIRHSRAPNSILSYSECLSIGKECGISTTEEVEKCLSFLHDVGVLCYFKALPDFVFKDTQLIYNKLTDVIGSTNGGEGFLTIESLKLGLQNLCHSDCTLPKVINLLQELCVLTSVNGEGEEKNYYLPCSPPACKEDDSEVVSIGLPVLFFKFQCKYCPTGFAEACIAHLLLLPSEEDYKFKAVNISCGQMSFSVGPCEDKFIFRFDSTYIRVQLTSSEESDRSIPVAKICFYVQKLISNSLDAINEQLYSEKAAKQAAFYCNKCASIVDVELKSEPFSCHMNCCSSQPLSNHCLMWFDEVRLKCGGARNG